MSNEATITSRSPGYASTSRYPAFGALRCRRGYCRLDVVSQGEEALGDRLSEHQRHEDTPGTDAIDQRAGDWHDDQARDGGARQERSDHGEVDAPDMMQVDERVRNHQPVSDHRHGVARDEQASRRR